MRFISSPVLEIKDFRLLFTTRIFSSMALQVQAVIIGWQIYQLTHDPLLLGLSGLVEAIPAIGCSFVSGHLVDIHRPAQIFRLSLLVLFVNAIFIFSSVAPFLAFDDHHRLIILFLGVFISGAARSFTSPSVFSLIPQVVPRSQLSAAAAWNSSSYQFASILGPALGGLAYGFMGAPTAFAIPALLMATAYFMSSLLSENTQALRSQFEREPFSKSLRTGISFVAKQKALLSAMTLDMFSVLFGGVVAILPVFSDQVLHTGSTGLGILRAAPSAGSAVVALFLAIRPLRVISGTALLVVVACFGATMIGFAMSTNLFVALAFLILSGAFDGISMVIRGTILQLLTPDKMRGRVSSLSSVFITSSNEIGAFESGLTTRVMGLIPSIIFGGCMTLIVVAATAWLAPELRQTRITSDDPGPAA